jgi:hypothetical protein
MTKHKIKSVILTILALLLIKTTCIAQITDSTLIRKLSINGLCLCNTTLSSMRQLNIDLKKVVVEEMDISKNCIGPDSRYEPSKGYYSDKYPGMIFQKDQTTDQISKIRLTKQFNGKLPDGKFISMGKLLLKDLLKMYPKLEDTWGSRDCSDFWNFSNDTISFYVKIDKSKQPQFPIDEAYYADKPIEGIDLFVSCYSFQKDAADDAVILFNPNDPVFFLDSIRVNRGVLENYKPSEFASVTVFKGASAISRVGPEGKNGVIYFETREFAKQRYWKYFKSKSANYVKIVSRSGSDSSIQYILNKLPLRDNYEADLAAINDKTFKSITIINKQQLTKDYGITDKDYGVIIFADVPNKKDK